MSFGRFMGDFDLGLVTIVDHDLRQRFEGLIIASGR